MTRQEAARRVVLAIDTSTETEAEYLAQVAELAGARMVKFGLELSSSTSWSYCSELAAAHRLDWIADAKLHDIPNTVQASVRSLATLEYPPLAATLHLSAGREALARAQAEAGPVKLLGVTALTSLSRKETKHIFRSSPERTVKRLASLAAKTGLAGVVASPAEAGFIKGSRGTRNFIVMTPGIRSAGSRLHDHHRTATPAEAINKGADWLAVGRQITQSENPEEALNSVMAEIMSAG